ncbi:unnamed protein product [Cercospora beticola]|nr:unnamed protein product [Cercospora beticola]
MMDHLNATNAFQIFCCNTLRLRDFSGPCAQKSVRMFLASPSSGLQYTCARVVSLFPRPEVGASKWRVANMSFGSWCGSFVETTVAFLLTIGLDQPRPGRRNSAELSMKTVVVYIQDAPGTLRAQILFQ